MRKEKKRARHGAYSVRQLHATEATQRLSVDCLVVVHAQYVVQQQEQREKRNWKVNSIGRDTTRCWCMWGWRGEVPLRATRTHIPFFFFFFSSFFLFVLLIPVKRTREKEEMDLCVNGRSSKDETKGERMKENEDSDGSSDVCKRLREI